MTMLPTKPTRKKQKAKIITTTIITPVVARQSFNGYSNFRSFITNLKKPFFLTTKTKFKCKQCDNKNSKDMKLKIFHTTRKGHCKYAFALVCVACGNLNYGYHNLNVFRDISNSFLSSVVAPQIKITPPLSFYKPL